MEVGNNIRNENDIDRMTITFGSSRLKNKIDSVTGKLALWNSWTSQTRTGCRINSGNFLSKRLLLRSDSKRSSSFSNSGLYVCFTFLLLWFSFFLIFQTFYFLQREHNTVKRKNLQNQVSVLVFNTKNKLPLFLFI